MIDPAVRDLLGLFHTVNQLSLECAAKYQDGVSRHAIECFDMNELGFDAWLEIDAGENKTVVAFLRAWVVNDSWSVTAHVEVVDVDGTTIMYEPDDVEALSQRQLREVVVGQRRDVLARCIASAGTA